TQEQVAAYLNISAAAVSKWENGLTSPDISLLPPLARLLKTDVNTLLSFTEDITEQEIHHFCEKITTLVREKGFAEGFQEAAEKIHEHPHNETLLHSLTLLLDSLLLLTDFSADERCSYEETLNSWYQRLSASNDEKIRNSADYMMVSRLIRSGRYDEAQAILNRMPDKADIMQSIADKSLLQILLYEEQGQPEKAAEDLQRMLLSSLTKTQLLLCKLVDAEVSAGEMQAAERIADKIAQMTPLFDLWPYNAFVAPLQISVKKQDADETIRLLKGLLQALQSPWDMASSPLFCRIQKNSSEKSAHPEFLSQILKSDLERDPGYDFLRDREDFKALLACCPSPEPPNQTV
ncbi:MAG: helix-turn-helix domain-containing protein, partial [Lachnospiraceae bacterium]|nr:helix-turn-helix domain-containing protein [Lachnospiraceae bacterium]